MFSSGRAFPKSLPFQLGANGGMLDFGVDATGITDAQDIGQTIYRNDVPWNFTKGVFTGLESAPGVYNATNISTLASVAATLKAANLTPLFVITTAAKPLCTTLATALTSLQTGITGLTFPAFPGGLPRTVAASDSIVLVDPSNQTHTQTITASASGAVDATTLAVNSFTANNNYPVGTWVFDTSWPPCTPQHLADLMVHLVSQPGLRGLHWELFNEPDGITWAAPATLVTQAYQLAYAAMKAADPTCVVHGGIIENLAPLGFPEGTTYYNSLVAAGILGNYDIFSFHQYSNNPNGNLDIPPDALNIWGSTYWQMIANFQANRISKGDITPMWCTEFGWQSGQKTTVAAGSNGVNVNTFTGSGTLNIASSSGYNTGGTQIATMPTSGGVATITYTGTGTGTLTGCTFISGDAGTLTTGAAVIGGNGQMTPQLQAQFFQNLLITLSGVDPVNGGKFSDYLKAMCVFTETGTFQDWSLDDGAKKPAYNLLKQIVAGR